MTASWLMGIAIVVLSCGYIFYGRFLSKRMDIDSKRVTPANTKQLFLDGFLC